MEPVKVIQSILEGIEQKFFGSSDRPNPIENIDLKQVPWPEQYKELVSRVIAERLLRVFEISTIGILLGGALIISAMLFLCYSPQDAETLVDKTIVPFLRGAATFATTVFGPLLAFILGFYFGKGETVRGKAKKINKE